MHILTFAGSLRADSYNKKFAAEALRLAKGMGHGGEFLDLKPLNLPLMDEDVEKTNFPEGASRLGEKIAAADAIIIATPEYNASISAPLKNALDWVSRLKPMPLAGKHVLLLGASPGALGAVRGLWHSRQPFDQLGAYLYPAMQGLPKAHEAFDDAGQLKDEKTASQLKELIEKFLAVAEK